jgi:C-terminal processing protease CtpA/Prc
MTLGGFLSLLGAFFPCGKSFTKESGELKISVNKIKFYLKSGCRFAVVSCGILLIIGSVYDGFKSYNEPKEVATKNDLAYVDWLESLPDSVGLTGCRFSFMDDGRLRITSVVVGCPAEIVGVKVGDVINKIDGLQVKNISKDELFRFISGAPGTYMKVELEQEQKIVNLEIERINATTLVKLIKHNR